jgi:hypothetical protein
MVQIGLALKDTGLDNVVFLQYPAVTDPDNPNRVVPNTSAATALKNALVNDLPVKLTGSTGAAAEDPTTAAPTTEPPADPAATTAPADPAATPTPSGPVALPPSVTGQTAAQQTCTKGNN